jgi:nucleoside triphosphatase
MPTNKKTQTFPEPIVGAIILNHRDEVLLLKSHKWSDMYSIPGGHIELGETVLEALMRETKEETGLDIADAHFVGIQESINDGLYFQPSHFIFIDFVCRASEAKVTLDDEAQDYVWIGIRDALELPLVSNTRQALRRCIDGNGTTASIADMPDKSESKRISGDT